MPDIFISYSRKDAEQATMLAEMLSSAGLSCWIDQSGIEAATSWSKEIVQAIDACRAFIVLLSPASIESHNVVKEVSLASEKRKKILPLDLESVQLTEDFQYHLAGIQRAPMTNVDAIIRALGKLGLEASQPPEAPKIVRSSDARKSLMILPFEDLSPTGDNGWFTDGIASEMVSSLSHVKALKVIDWNTSSMLKNKKIKTVELAREFDVQYFIEGQVRKFGDQIKISMTLLDIETGDHLWQESLRGVMNDIFDIQEQCAERVLEGLKLHVTKAESALLTRKLTHDSEAYELYLKAGVYYNRHTRIDYEHALALYEEAVRLDPGFVTAHASIANTCAQLYRVYDRSDQLLDRAKAAASKVKELEGESAKYCWVMSILSRDDRERALGFAQRAVETDPALDLGYSALGVAYEALGRPEEAVRAREEFVRLRENSTNAHFGLLLSLNELGSSPQARERLRIATERAIPVFERHLRLNPDDNSARVQLVIVFRWAGGLAEALSEADRLSTVESLDGVAFYNLACVYVQCREFDRGLISLHRSITKGFRNIAVFRGDPDLDPLRGKPEFERLMNELEASANG